MQDAETVLLKGVSCFEASIQVVSNWVLLDYNCIESMFPVLLSSGCVVESDIFVNRQNNNLLDLNFSMQHLLVRVMFQMNSKAALIQLQKYTKEAEE